MNWEFLILNITISIVFNLSRRLNISTTIEFKAAINTAQIRPLRFAKGWKSFVYMSWLFYGCIYISVIKTKF